MADLFDSMSINSLNLANRFIRSATGTGMSNEHGQVTPKLTKHLMELVEGGVGLIISGHRLCPPKRTSIISSTLYLQRLTSTRTHRNG